MTERKVQEEELESVFPSPSAPDQPGDSIGELPVSGATSSAGSISLRESAIEETDLKEELSPAPPAELGEGRMEALAKGTIPPPMQEESSLLAKITPATAPRSALSLRLAEEGRRLLENQEYEKALAKLEKAIALDSRNRFGYYYLARAHYHLGDQRQSLNFLEIVEPILIEEPVWLARVLALKGKNYVALGSFRRADESYAKALEVDPYNQEALVGLSIISSKQ